MQPGAIIFRLLAMTCIEPLRVWTAFLRRRSTSGRRAVPAAEVKRPQARCRRPPIEAGSTWSAHAAGTLRPHVQVTLEKPDAAVETHPTPGTHASSVHGSPSSHADAPSRQDGSDGGGGGPDGGGGGEVTGGPSTLIGWVRAIGTGRCEPGSGLSSRSSYQPAARSAGTRSCSWP